MSSAIATSILRRLSAWLSLLAIRGWASPVRVSSRVSLVTPSTSFATSSPNLFRDVLEGHAAVLDDVMEERGGDRWSVEVQVREIAGGGDGVLDVGFPGPARLPRVGFGGEVERPLDKLRPVRRKVLAHSLQKLLHGAIIARLSGTP